MLRPLHDGLFSLLKTLPNDGTFDQDASFKRCVKKASETNHAFGYDLSAATDRLPISLQVSILTALIGREAAEAWRGLLVERFYWIPKNPYMEGEYNIRYTVGQPMGALSSWAMLALTHHLIVQFCAIRVHPVSYWTRFKG